MLLPLLLLVCAELPPPPVLEADYTLKGLSKSNDPSFNFSFSNPLLEFLVEEVNGFESP